LAIREVFGIFIRGFSGRAPYNQYSARQHSRNTKFSGFDISGGDSFLSYRGIMNGILPKDIVYSSICASHG